MRPKFHYKYILIHILLVTQIYYNKIRYYYKITSIRSEVILHWSAPIDEISERSVLTVRSQNFQAATRKSKSKLLVKTSQAVWLFATLQWVKGWNDIICDKRALLCFKTLIIWASRERNLAWNVIIIIYVFHDYIFIVNKRSKFLYPSAGSPNKQKKAVSIK
jgi:hypothetical protein